MREPWNGAIVPCGTGGHCDISHSCEYLFPCCAGRIFVSTAGNLDRHRIKVLVGDKVDVVMSEYDPGRGGIVYRH